MLLFNILFSLSGFGQAGQPLDRRINFKVDKVSVSEALRELRQASNLHVTYNTEETDKQPKVSVDLRSETVRRILEKIVEPTDLQFVETADGGVLIIPRKRHSDGPKATPWINITGQVFDPQGSPLSKASVVVADPKLGTTTNEKGMFSLVAPIGSTLKISYLGMKEELRVVRTAGFIKVQLDSASNAMHEYVVTGYQRVDKRLLASSTFTLTPEQLLEPNVASIDQMIQGKVPGVIVVNNSGSPSASPKIRIRGTSTFLGNAAPLWVIDGVIKEDPVDLNPLQVNAALADAQNANFSIVGNAISGVNPYDIESITFLKDASATAIYGVRAANGVIVVTTKKGKAGNTAVSYNTSLGFTAKPSYMSANAMNSKERVDVSREIEARHIFYEDVPFGTSYEGLLAQLNSRAITQEQFTQGVAALETMNTDWFGRLSHNAFNQTHSLSVSGGAGKTSFYSSFSYSNNNGTMNGDNTKRYTALINLETQVNSRINFGLGINAYYRTADGYFTVNPLDYALTTSRAISPDSAYPTAISTLWMAGGTGTHLLHYNIFNELANTGNQNSTRDILARANVGIRLLPGLSYAGFFSADLSGDRSFDWASDHSYYVANNRGYDFGTVAQGSVQQQISQLPFGGKAFPASQDNLTYTARNSLQFDKALFGGRDQLSVMATQEVRSTKADGFKSYELGYYPDRGQTYYSTYYNSGGGGVAAPLGHYAGTVNTTVNTVSWLGVASYSLKKRYILNVNFRTDGSNRFGQYSNQRFLPNWSVAGRWNVTDEPWMYKSRVLSGLSLRVSYGTQGNVVSDVGPNLIASYPSSPVDPATNEYVLSLKSLPYPYLRWEKSNMYNFGGDLSLFNGRVSVTVDGYFRHSTDLLVSRTIPQEYGLPAMYMNYGSLDNAGIDGFANVVAVKTKDFEWDQNFVYSRNFDKVQQSGVQNTFGDYLNGGAIIPGKPFSSLYSYSFAGLDHQNGYPLYNKLSKYVGPTVNPVNFLVYSGQQDPKVSIGTGTTLRYKALTLTANFAVSLGNVRRLNPIYLTTTRYGAPPPNLNLPKDLNNRWRSPGDEAKTNIPGFSNWYQEGGAVINPADGTPMSPYAMYDLSDARVVNANFLRCRTIMASYSLPGRIVRHAGVRSASVTAGVTNPFVIESGRWHGQDPEIANTRTTALPIIASYSMSMNVTF